MRSCIQRRGNVYMKFMPEMQVNYIGYADSSPDVYSSSTSSTLGAACACLLLTSPLPLLVPVTVAVVVFVVSEPFSPFLLFFDFFFFSYEEIRVSEAPRPSDYNGKVEEDNLPPATPKPA